MRENYSVMFIGSMIRCEIRANNSSFAAVLGQMAIRDLKKKMLNLAKVKDGILTGNHKRSLSILLKICSQVSFN